MRTVLVIDHQRSYAEAVALAIDVQEDLECVGIALDADAWTTVFDDAVPDVVLIDVHLPHADGIEVAHDVLTRRPDADVVVLTHAPDSEMLARAIDAGVAAFLLKDQPLDDVLEAVRHAAGALVGLRPEILAVVLAQPVPVALPAAVQPLTDREQTVLELLGAGLVPKQIARELDITLNTARGHIKAILAKLDSHSALEAVLAAQQLGLLTGVPQDAGPSGEDLPEAPAEA